MCAARKDLIEQIPDFVLCLKFHILIDDGSIHVFCLSRHCADVFSHEQHFAAFAHEAATCKEHECGFSAAVRSYKADKTAWKGGGKMLEDRAGNDCVSVCVCVAIDWRVCECYVVKFYEVHISTIPNNETKVKNDA